MTTELAPLAAADILLFPSLFSVPIITELSPAPGKKTPRAVF